MNVLDLFSGVGGFSLGLERTGGFRTAAFVEIDPYCRKVLARHWPGIPIHDDIRRLDGIQYAGAVDVVCGGYPCQPFSAAGKQLAEADPRHLWPEMHRIIREARPRWVVAENVRGHVGLGFDTVASQLEDDGFTVWPFIVPACAVGAPHRRDRLWILAHANSRSGYTGPKRSGWEARPNLDRSGTRAIVADPSGGRCRGARIGEMEQPGRAEVEYSGKALGHPTGEGLFPSTHAGVHRQTEDERARDAQSERRGSDVADAMCSRRETGLPEAGYGQEGYTEVAFDGSDRLRGWEASNQWAVEPDVGGRLDGFSSWLDRLDMTIPHALLMADGVTEARAREGLLAMRHSTEAEAVWQSARGHGSVSPQGVLLAYLRQLQSRSTDETRLQLPRSEAPQGTLRGLFGNNLFACPPHRSSEGEQSPVEHPDPLQALSRLLACHAEKAWVAYCRENAVPRGWEEGINRVCSGIPARVDRLRALGNAVVPQIPELIGRTIIAYEQQLGLAA